MQTEWRVLEPTPFSTEGKITPAVEQLDGKELLLAAIPKHTSVFVCLLMWLPQRLSSKIAKPKNTSWNLIISVNAGLRLLDIKVMNVPNYNSVGVGLSVSSLDNFDIVSGPREPASSYSCNYSSGIPGSPLALPLHRGDL